MLSPKPRSTLKQSRFKGCISCHSEQKLLKFEYQLLQPFLTWHTNRISFAYDGLTVTAVNNFLTENRYADKLVEPKVSKRSSVCRIFILSQVWEFWDLCYIYYLRYRVSREVTLQKRGENVTFEAWFCFLGHYVWLAVMPVSLNQMRKEINPLQAEILKFISNHLNRTKVCFNCH